MSARSWLVQLYPRRWRERYGEEFEALLEECLHTPLDGLDILLGALDAHLEFPYEMNWRLMNMINKLRTSILLVFTGYIGFILGGMSLYGLADDSPMAALMKTNTDTPLFAAWTTVQIGAVVALLAVVVGGLPLAWTVIRRAFTSSREDLRLLLVPVFAFLALVVYAGFVALVGLGRLQIPGVLPVVSHDNFPIGNRLLIGGAMLVFVLGAVASTAAVWKVISNIDAEQGTTHTPGGRTSAEMYRVAFVPAVLTAFSMLLMLIATLVWGWLGYLALPQVFAENWGLLNSNTTLSFAVIVSIMALSTAVAFFGVARGYSARKTVSPERNENHVR